MDTTQMEIAVNITHAESCQQSKLIPNHLAHNCKERSILITVSLFASVAKAALQSTYFHQRDYIGFKVASLGVISAKHVSLQLKQFIEWGLITKRACGYYELTELGQKLHNSGFKYHITRLVNLKRVCKNEVLGYLKSMSDGTLFSSGKQSGKLFSACSYIEERKNELINISSRLYGTFVDHLSMTPEQRMQKHLRKRNPDIEEKDFERLFARIKLNVGYIKSDRWFDELDTCFKTMHDWLQHCRSEYKDGDDYFATMWAKMGRTKWFNNAKDLYDTLEKLIFNNREEWERDNTTHCVSQ